MKIRRGEVEFVQTSPNSWSVKANHITIGKFHRLRGDWFFRGTVTFAAELLTDLAAWREVVESDAGAAK